MLLDLGQFDPKLLVKDFTTHKFEILALTFTDESNKFTMNSREIIAWNNGEGPRTDFESYESRRLTRFNVENFSSIFTNNSWF